ncbi:hypothetical protein FPV67DRAFT_1665903 [Lyophyllum atratum]|nr:hypothetical protein FPV67DRAFT_1665903 [Lyophyllum atratum]
MATKTASNIIWIPALEEALFRRIQKTLLRAQYSCEWAPVSPTQLQRVFVRDQVQRNRFEWAGDGYLSCAILVLLSKFFPDRPLLFYGHTRRALCRNKTFTMLMCKIGLAPNKARARVKGYANIFEMFVGVLWFDGELDILDDWIEDTFLELATAAEDSFHLFMRLHPLHPSPSASSPADILGVAPCTATPAVSSSAIAGPSTFSSTCSVSAATSSAAMTPGPSAAPGGSSSSSPYSAADPSSAAGPFVTDALWSVKGCYSPTVDRPALDFRATVIPPVGPLSRRDPLSTPGRDILVPKAVISPVNDDHPQRQSPRKRRRVSDAFFPTPERGEKRQKLSNAPFLEIRATSPSPRPDPLPTPGRDTLVPTALILPGNGDHSQRQSPRKRHRALDTFFPTPERGQKRQKLSNAPFLEIRNRVPPSDLFPSHTQCLQLLAELDAASLWTSFQIRNLVPSPSFEKAKNPWTLSARLCFLFGASLARVAVLAIKKEGEFGTINGKDKANLKEEADEGPHDEDTSDNEDTSTRPLVCFASPRALNKPRLGVNAPKDLLREIRLDASCILRKRACIRQCTCDSTSTGSFSDPGILINAESPATSRDPFPDTGDALFLRGHLPIFFGLLIRGSPENQAYILDALDGAAAAERLVEHAREFVAFYAALGGEGAAAEAEGKVGRDVVAFLEGLRTWFLFSDFPSLTRTVER